MLFGAFIGIWMWIGTFFQAPDAWFAHLPKIELHMMQQHIEKTGHALTRTGFQEVQDAYKAQQRRQQSSMEMRGLPPLSASAQHQITLIQNEEKPE